MKEEKRVISVEDSFLRYSSGEKVPVEFKVEGSSAEVFFNNLCVCDKDGGQLFIKCRFLEKSQS